MSEWNFMDPASRGNVMAAWQHESDRFFELAAGDWEAPTACAEWQVRDVVGHLVDTTEGYFTAFAAARGEGEAAAPLGLTDMARLVDAGAKSLRTESQQALIERCRDDRDRMMATIEQLTDEQWAGMMVPHKYMGPIPASFYAIFQVVDYGVHSWDIPQGVGRGFAMDGDTADLLVPPCFIVWQSTPSVPEGTEPYSLGVRITSGRNAGDTRVTVSADGIVMEPAAVDDLPTILEFDPASFVLTAYGRVNGGTLRGDPVIAQQFLSLFFRI